MKSRHYKVKIEGIAPLRFNRFTEEEEKRMLQRKSRKMNTDEERVADAWERVYMTEDGKLYIPKHALRACVINGSKRIKIGRRAATSEVQSLLAITSDAVIEVEKDKIVVEKEAVRIPPRTGAMAIKYFITVLPPYTAEFDLVVWGDTIAEDVLKEILELSGIYAGLLERRPFYGRFVIKELKLIKSDK